MIILPYYITEKTLSLGCKMWTLWIFMSSSGKELWKADADETPDQIVKEYLNDNGIVGDVQESSRKDMLLYKVNREKTNMKDFHTWADSLSGEMEHVWRPFFWIGEVCGETDSWGWKEEVDTLKLDPLHTIGEIWSVVGISGLRGRV